MSSAFRCLRRVVEFYGSVRMKRVTVTPGPAEDQPPPGRGGAETKKGGYNIAVLVTGPSRSRRWTSRPTAVEPDRDIVSLLAFGVTTQKPVFRTGTGRLPVGGTAAIAIGSTVGVDEKIRSTVGLDKVRHIETGFRRPPSP